LFLKRLDVLGFKSFAERISLDLVPGVTAVVGPNGSGKSNIIDAIRWVLGEQSAKSLRGTKMEDIIFAGSDARKSLNYAEVSLVLDNSDQFLPMEYNEISVTRRVFRSGESEFLINNQACRLKDIIDLFMDSGLGREAFSIISQGKVEEILNNKAEDRRAIFEEAAGVLKYKNRKKKAEIKLNETKENLLRVNDILSELETQVEPLKMQASVAKEFLEQKALLEQYEVALIVKEIEDLNNSYESIKKALTQNKESERTLSVELQSKEATLISLREQAQILDESILDLQDVLMSVGQELEKIEGKKGVLIERKQNASTNKQTLEEQIAELEQKEVLLKSTIQVERDNYQQLLSEVKHLEEQLKIRKTEFKAFDENVAEKIEVLKSEYIDKLSDQATLNNELKNSDAQLQQIQSKLDKLDKENVQYIEERNTINQLMANKQNAVEEVQKKLDSHVAQYTSLQRQLESLQTKYTKAESSLYTAMQYLQKVKSRYETLNELEEDYSGFNQGVKEVLKAKNEKLKGIYGAIAELIQVPKGYELAIETALSGGMQSIVVSDEAAARAAIDFLKKNQYGRATFLPLNTIKERRLNEAQKRLVENHPSFIGEAIDLVSFDAKFDAAISSQLGTIVIAKDLKGANDIAKTLSHRCRIVTVEGDVVNVGGSMTGGATKKSGSTIFSRKVEIEELKEKIAVMEKDIVLAEQKVKDMKQSMTTMQQDIEEERLAGEELRQEEQKAQNEKLQIDYQLKTINERLQIYDYEKVELTEEKENLQTKITNTQELLTTLKAEINQLNELIETLSKQKQNDTSLKDQLQVMIQELQINYTSKKEQFTYLEAKLNTLTTDFEQITQKLESTKEDLHLLVSEMESSHSGEEQLIQLSVQKAQAKEQTTELIAKRREDRLRVANEINALDLDVKELNRRYKGLVEAIHHEEVKLNRLEVELDNCLAHLSTEYVLSFEAAKAQYELTVPLEEAKRKVKLIKLAIQELGSVNLGAIDEYDRVSERYQFLVEQKEDLTNAKETLFTVIDEMDEEMKRRFENTFKGISEHFEVVFGQLFGGGRAELRLTNPQDLLSSGVEIIAQPPGKKLQNLALLSGGERALTAIALLFAILKTRPVPFCILDEVEAALDEANVIRFSKFLRQFSLDSQFIVITHRKGTMEEADVLYGVTMQESGVSKLVSVRLEETDEYITV